MATVNTVLGPISSDDLGVTLMHEHILYGYPGWDGDRTIAPLDRQAIVAAGVETLKQLKDEYGLNSYVDATALDGGRMPDILKEVSEKSGVNIICSTGYYYEGEGSPTYWKFRSSLGDVSGELYDLFMTEVTQGIMDTGIKAGALKVGSSKGEITDYEKIMFQTAARVSKETGVPIITHTQEGTMGPEQAELLIAAGANPKQIQIGHMSDNVDIQYQEETFKHGVYVSWDRMGLQGLVGCPMDAERIPVMIELIKKGYADKMMISHDFIITWLGRPLNLPEEALPLIANWHPSHLFKNIIPAFKEAGVTDDQINSIIKENPRRLFAGE
ncbi:phosphotriesterase-related protein [Desulfatibacillum alkenivorans DSM 16219]|jgi:phosphotriesterase-related protein|uniref:Phosphotriesterase-related protein n=1 Tax=Desulfatibacillum alkenivorans DSM 16219 TaxID=1121393 RepID=A0A1M6PBD3_9BACT|nr:phosphotriesterase-related protein [Desulfatibacillum alkenivorans]SHK05237.1 phosphotriesterase-related protein [Desulfatibacillum alkenivorans DSM 16219]